MQTERLREGRWEAGAGPRHTAVQFTPSASYSVPPHFGPMPAPESQPAPSTPCTHPHRSIILPSPHPPPLPTGSRIKATRDAATDLLLLGKIESLSIETSRAGGLGGPQSLGSGLSLGSVSPPSSHREYPHQCPPSPRALGQACAIFTRTPSILRFPKSH